MCQHHKVFIECLSMTLNHFRVQDVDVSITQQLLMLKL